MPWFQRLYFLKHYSPNYLINLVILSKNHLKSTLTLHLLLSRAVSVIIPHMNKNPIEQGRDILTQTVSRRVALQGTAIFFSGLAAACGKQDAAVQVPPPIEARHSADMPPSQLLDLTNWKITLPSGRATEVKQPALATYQDDTFRVVSTDLGVGVRFKAGVSGGTTSGSGYPRSELREMTNTGATNAAWSPVDDATHTMLLDQAITGLPKKKPHIVAGQIHDANDDTVVIRLEGSRLFVNYTDKQGNKNQKVLLSDRYVLGERFQIQITVNNGQTEVWYKNGENKQNVLLSTIDSPGQYFKAGAYTQSNCSTEGLPVGCDDRDNYGEVVIYSLLVTHQ